MALQQYSVMLMKKRLTTSYTVLFIAVLIMCGPLSHAGAKGRWETLKEKYDYWLSEENDDSCLAYAIRLRSLARETGDISQELLSDSYIGSAYAMLCIRDSAVHYMNKGLRTWDAIDSACRDGSAYKAIINIYNSLGILYGHERDYSSSIQYFQEGLRIAASHGDIPNCVTLAGNIVTAYYIKGDTAGITLADKIYAHSRKSGDRHSAYVGAYSCAMMYYLKGDIDTAGQYAIEALELCGGQSSKSELYCLYANILYKQGNVDDAEIYYKKSLENLGDISVTSAILTYVSYSGYLIAEGMTEKAITYINEGLEYSAANDNMAYYDRLYLLLSKAYELSGDWRSALEAHKKYVHEAMAINMIEQERQINELLRKYENEKFERELGERTLIIQKQSYRLRIFIVITTLTCAALIIICIMLRNKSRMYGRIAVQYRDSVLKEREMKRQLEELRTQQKEPCSGKYKTSSLTTEDSGSIFNSLEDLMKNERIYRKCNLTRETVAERLGTNRTYLSQVINERTGKTFLAYVNSYRIEEASVILSDPEDDTPLKALSADLGFSSINTFYRIFAEKAGMTPAKYREKIRRLPKNTI